MKPLLLFPSFFRLIGYPLAAAGLVFGFIYVYLDKVLIFADNGSHNYTLELGTTSEILGLMFIGFGRLKNENVQSNSLRLYALYWAVLIDFVILLFWWVLQLIDTWLKSNFSYPFRSLSDYNLFILLFIFIGRFYYSLYRDKKSKKELSLLLLSYKPYLFIVRSVCILFFILIWASIQFLELGDLMKKVLPDELFILFPICLLIWIWSEESREKLSITYIRLKSMQLAVYINYGLYLIATWV